MILLVHSGILTVIESCMGNQFAIGSIESELDLDTINALWKQCVMYAHDG